MSVQNKGQLFWLEIKPLVTDSIFCPTTIMPAFPTLLNSAYYSFRYKNNISDAFLLLAAMYAWNKGESKFISNEIAHLSWQTWHQSSIFRKKMSATALKTCRREVGKEMERKKWVVCSHEEWNQLDKWLMPGPKMHHCSLY